MKFILRFVFLILFVCVSVLPVLAPTPAAASSPTMTSEETQRVLGYINAIVPPPSGKCPATSDKKPANIQDECFSVFSLEDYQNYKSVFPNLKPENIGYCTTNITVPCEYTACDLIQIFVNITRFVMGIIGSVVLLFFMYASLLFITAQGDSEKIVKGRKAIRAAVTGLVIVMLSYQIIGIVLSILINNGNVLGDRPGNVPTGTSIAQPWDSLANIKNKCK